MGCRRRDTEHTTTAQIEVIEPKEKLVRVRAQVPGYSALSVRSSIAVPVETALQRVQGIQSVVSSSRAQRATWILAPAHGVTTEQLLTSVRNELKQIEAQLPREIEQLTVDRLQTESSIRFIASPVQPDARPEREPPWMTRLGAIPGVTDVRVCGIRTPTWVVATTTRCLLEQGKTWLDAYELLRQEPLDLERETVSFPPPFNVCLQARREWRSRECTVVPLNHLVGEVDVDSSARNDVLAALESAQRSEHSTWSIQFDAAREKRSLVGWTTHLPDANAAQALLEAGTRTLQSLIPQARTLVLVHSDDPAWTPSSAHVLLFATLPTTLTDEQFATLETQANTAISSRVPQRTPLRLLDQRSDQLLVTFVLHDASRDIASVDAWMEQVRSWSETRTVDRLASQDPETQLRIDRTRAASLGVSIADLSLAANAVLHPEGVLIPRKANATPLLLTLMVRSSIGDRLDDIQVASSTHQLIPLSTLLDASTETTDTVFVREDGQDITTVWVQSRTDPVDAAFRTKLEQSLHALEQSRHVQGRLRTLHDVRPLQWLAR